MRYFLLAAALLSSTAHGEPAATVSADDLHHARGLGAGYRQCQLDALGERYLDPAVVDAMQLASEIESSCRPKLDLVRSFLAARGYARGHGADRARRHQGAR